MGGFCRASTIRKMIITTLNTPKLPINIIFRVVSENSLVPIKTRRMNETIMTASTKSLFIFIFVIFCYLLYSSSGISSEVGGVLRPFIIPKRPTPKAPITTTNFT